MQTLPQFIQQVLSDSRPDAFAERLGAPEWRMTSTTRMLERASALAYALRELGLAAGDRVVLIAQNRVDWIAADFGTLLAGCVVVPTFATLALDQVDYIFKDCAAKAAFVESPADAERLRASCPNAPRIIAFDSIGPDSLALFEAQGAKARAADPAGLQRFTQDLRPDDLAVLMYTSGTTGNPKGVMLTHRNLIWNATAAFTYGLDGVDVAGERALTILPLAHIYGHANMLGTLLFRSNFYVSQPDFLIEDLRSIRPRTMALVPRIFERVLASVQGKAKAEGGLKAKLVPWALQVAHDSMLATLEGKKQSPVLALQQALAQRLVYAKIKETLGLDRIEYLVSGSAALHRDIALTFGGMGLPVCEGYGLTETAPTVSFNKLAGMRYGSVGRPIPGVEVKIAGDGEILVRGPNVMSGYHHAGGNSPFTPDGWFATGDIGRLDDDGYLYVTDRKNELLKTSGGKFVAPSRVEAALRRSIYIGQCFVIGDNRPFPIALVAPNWELLRAEFGIPAGVASAQVASRPDVRELIEREVRQNTADLATFEQIRRVVLLPRDLTIEDGELSPTLKVKRRVVEKKFSDAIEAAYGTGIAPALR